MSFDETEVRSRISVSEQSSVRIAGSRILYFDPFHIRTESRDADFIFLTHDHFDHYSPADIRKVRNGDTIFFLPETMIGVLSKLGADADHAVLFRPGDRRVLYDVAVEAVPAYNPSKPFHPRENGWLGYLVEMDGLSFYVPGDTDLTPEAESVKADVLFAPIGGKYTMDPAEAAELTNRIRPRAAVPIHYGTVVGRPGQAEEYRALVDRSIPVWELLSF